jgi:hypothetical protein
MWPALILLVPLSAGAQEATVPQDRLASWAISPRTGSPQDGWPRDPLPNWSIPARGHVQLPQIGLPLPRIGLDPQNAVPQNRVGRPRRDNRDRKWLGSPWVVYAVPQIFYAEPAYQTPAPAPEPPPAGRLVINVEPATAQIFAGGYYLGTAEDMDALAGGARLEPGAYRVEISAPGYETVSFLASVRPDQSTTYRRVLQPIEPPATSAASTGAPTTFYVIPGCYMGNVPPKDARLPASCDISKTITIQQ